MPSGEFGFRRGRNAFSFVDSKESEEKLFGIDAVSDLRTLFRILFGPKEAWALKACLVAVFVLRLR